jgi:hypothetical protein
MTVEDEQGTEQDVETEAAAAEAAPDVDAEDDIEAHVWRAQS